jgi:hypothetical protein
MQKAVTPKEGTEGFPPGLAHSYKSHREVFLDDDAPEDLVVERLQAGGSRAFEIISIATRTRVCPHVAFSNLPLLSV